MASTIKYSHDLQVKNCSQVTSAQAFWQQCLVECLLQVRHLPVLVGLWATFLQRMLKVYGLGPGTLTKIVWGHHAQQNATVIYSSNSSLYVFIFFSNMLFYNVLSLLYVQNGNNILSNAGIV